GQPRPEPTRALTFSIRFMGPHGEVRSKTYAIRRASFCAVLRTYQASSNAFAKNLEPVFATAARGPTGHSPTSALAQTWARVHPQVHPAADGVPLRRDRDCLADDVQIAPALGQAALALERRAATVPVHQVHRLARVVGGVDGGQPAAGP